MPFEPTELRISLQKVLVALVLLIVPLSIIGLYITSRGDHRLEQSSAERHVALAESASTIINRFASDRITDCRVIANTASVLEAVNASNKSYAGLADTAVKDRIERVRRSWNAAELDPALKALLSSGASRMLRQHREMDPRFLRITVSDQRGAAVAATDKPADYLQSEESYWPAVYADGRGAVAIRNVLFDDASRSNYIGIAVPVLDPTVHEFIGAVHALVDVSGLLWEVTAIDRSSTSRMIIAKDDGTIVLGSGITLSNNLKSEEYAAVREALGTAAGRQKGYTTTDLRNAGRTIVSFAETGVGAGNRGLSLIVMVSQSIRDATEPLRAVGNFALAMVVLGLLILTLTGVYVLLHRHVEFEEIEPLGENLTSQARRASA